MLLDMVVPKKSQVNLFVPGPVLAEFNVLAEPLGPKRRWVLVTTAMLLLIEADPAKVYELRNAVNNADMDGDEAFRRLVEHAKARRPRAPGELQPTSVAPRSKAPPANPQLSSGNDPPTAGGRPRKRG